MVGKPGRTGAEAGADFEHRSRAQLGNQRRIDGEIEHVLHQRRAAPAHQRWRALAGQQHVDAEFGAEARIVVGRRPLALAELHEAPLLPAIEKKPQPMQIPLQTLVLAPGLASRSRGRCPPTNGSDRIGSNG